MSNSKKLKSAAFDKQRLKPAFIQPLQFVFVANEAIASAVVAKPAQTMVAAPAENIMVAAMLQPFAATVVKENLKSVPLREEVIFSQLAEAKFFNPMLGINLAAVVPPVNGQPREQITVPISPGEQITDELLFESPTEPGKKFYLPRYRIQQEEVSGAPQMRAALELDGEGGTLTINLQPYAADAVAEASRTAAVLPHGASVLLQYNVGGSLRELEFLDKTDTLDQVILRLNSHELYIQVYRAVSEGNASGAKLIIRRLIQVAVPVPLPPPPKHRPRPHFPPEEIDPDLPPGLKKRLMRRNRFDVPISPALAGTLELVATPQVQLYRTTDRALDVPPITVDWPIDMCGYIYKSPSPPPTSSNDSGLTIRSLEFEGRTHRYFQNNASREIFYCLPDSFKLARQPNSPYYPFMSVRFWSPDGLLSTTQAKLEYVAVPFAKAARLKAASEQLAIFAPGKNPRDIKVQPLLATEVKFRLAVPGSGSSAGPYQQRDDVKIDLSFALSDELTLSMNDFQIIYNALATPNSILFQGEILVKVHEGLEEKIPFMARLNDLAGEVFDFESVPDAATGTIAVTLRNAIESPVDISRLTASLFYDDVEVPATLSQLNLPVEVKSEDAVSFQVLPASANDVRPGVVPRVVFDMETIVRPDLAAVWASIIDHGEANQYEKAVTIKTFKELFSDPEWPVGAVILVDVQGGETVELSPDMLVANTVARLPLGDVVLNVPVDGQFRFRVSIVQPSGSRIGEWQTSPSTTLFITKPLLP